MTAEGWGDVSPVLVLNGLWFKGRPTSLQPFGIIRLVLHWERTPQVPHPPFLSASAALPCSLTLIHCHSLTPMGQENETLSWQEGLALQAFFFFYLVVSVLNFSLVSLEASSPKL